MSNFNRQEASALREQRKKAHEFMASVLVKPQTAETRAKVQTILNDLDRMTAAIEKIENPGTYVKEARYNDEGDASHTIAFSKWVRGGLDNLSVEQRNAVMAKVEKRDLTEGSQIAHVGSYSSLGFFVPTGFVNSVEQAKKWYSSFDAIAQVMKTASGNALPYPVSNDTAQAATVITESSETTELDGNTSNHVVFGAYKLKSGLIKVSSELLQDSSIDVDSWLAERFAERFGRGEESYFTTGSGSGQPTGILTAIAASGSTPVTAAGANANSGLSGDDGTNSIGYADLINLEHSVDPSYRRSAQYMLHDNTLGILKRMLDKFGRPLWVPSIAVGEPSTLNGFKYSINQHMPQVAPSATSLVFGDFSKFVVRRVSSMSVRRLAERYAEFDEVGFLAFERVDSNLLDAGTHPLNVLVQHS
jgi:HK97 family phage major capsid protein